MLNTFNTTLSTKKEKEILTKFIKSTRIAVEVNRSLFDDTWTVVIYTKKLHEKWTRFYQNHLNDKI